MTYKESLTHKNWYKKRSEILKRDNFKCTICGNVESLCVHHTYYYKGNPIEAWKYPSESLMTLCYNCHNEYHAVCEIPIIDKPKPRRKVKDKNKKLLDKLYKSAIRAEKKIKAKYN